MKELKIEPPEGYEVDKEHSTFEYIKFKPIKPQLPKTWEEFCKNHPFKVGESWISNNEIHTFTSNHDIVNYSRLPERDKNVFPSEQYTKAMLALCQLIQLRDCYNDGWMPDWSNEYNDKWCIEMFRGRIDKATHSVAACVLAFKSDALRDEFLENFRDLIEIAKPLL